MNADIFQVFSPKRHGMSRSSWEPTSPVTVTQEGDIWVYLTRWCAGAGACGQIAAIVINSEVKCL